MRLGYFTHVVGGSRPAEAYRETVRLAVAAERLGYDSFWVAQHHGRPSAGWLPSPLLLLAAVAEHTSTIALGTAVVAAPLEHPHRLAEDAAVLDALSGGRLRLGLGAGSDPRASAEFGTDHSARHGDALAVLDRLCALLDGPTLVPPAPGLRGRLWWATGSPAGADAAAERGLGLLCARPPGPAVLADLARYRARATGRARVTVSRVAGPDRAGELRREWSVDPVLAGADELLVQA
ncbi:MAG TPA: LLM class flavin-dependent oxidoreductase, partial [Pseudonocardia sp.]